MTTHDAFFNDLDQPDWMADWVHAELQALNFDISDTVLNHLNDPAPLLSTEVKTRQLLDDYYDVVSRQCPDLWPVVLTRLSQQPNVVPIRWTRIAASLLAIVTVGAAGFNMWHAGSSQLQVASLPTTPAASILADPTPVKKTASTMANPVALPKVKVVTSRKVLMPTKVKSRREALPAAVIPAVPRAQRVQQAILATAAQAIKQQSVADAPGSLDYVFNVSSPAKDDLVLGLASP